MARRDEAAGMLPRQAHVCANILPHKLSPLPPTTPWTAQQPRAPTPPPATPALDAAHAREAALRAEIDLLQQRLQQVKNWRKNVFVFVFVKNIFAPLAGPLAPFAPLSCFAQEQTRANNLEKSMEGFITVEIPSKGGPVQMSIKVRSRPPSTRTSVCLKCVCVCVFVYWCVCVFVCVFVCVCVCVCV